MTRASGAIGGISDVALARRGLNFGRPLVRPAGFDLPRAAFPFDFWRDASGRVRTSFDRRTWAPTPDVTPWTSPITYYADASRPTDTGDGLSWATAKRAIGSAITAGNAQGNPFIVMVRAGVYTRGLSPTGASGTIVPNKPCAIVAVGGRVETGFFDELNWVRDQGTTYSAARSNVRRIVDLARVDGRGLYPDLAWAASLAACRETPGSWWTDNANLYVNRGDGSAVSNANTRAFMIVGATGPLRMSSGGNMYVSGLDLQGALPILLSGSPGNRFVAEDCTARYSSGEDGVITAASGPRDGVTVLDVAGAAFIRCDASANQKDGFNAHIGGSTRPFMFTMDCTGQSNGRLGSTSCNGITTHDGCKGIDLRGVYVDNAGGQVAIVHDDTQLWCIDTLAHDSRGDMIHGGIVPPADFLVDQGNPTLFLENCAAAGSRYALHARFGRILTRGGKFAAERHVANGAVLAEYD